MNVFLFTQFFFLFSIRYKRRSTCPLLYRLSPGCGLKLQNKSCSFSTFSNSVFLKKTCNAAPSHAEQLLVPFKLENVYEKRAKGRVWIVSCGNRNGEAFLLVWPVKWRKALRGSIWTLVWYFSSQYPVLPLYPVSLRKTTSKYQQKSTNR